MAFRDVYNIDKINTQNYKLIQFYLIICLSHIKLPQDHHLYKMYVRPPLSGII